MFGFGNFAVAVKARAKVNLALNITGKRGEMHLIDTVIVPIGLEDTVTVSQSDAFSVAYMDGRTYDKDIALKAAKLISEQFGTPPVRAEIDKRIPEGKGLGGSSADAAGVARAMQKLYGICDIPSELLIKIGSDVPAMYADCPVRVRGIGEKVEKIHLKSLHILLLAGNDTVNTAEAYALYDRIGGDAVDIDEFLAGGSAPKNALERAALAIAPRMGNLRDMLKKTGIRHVVMTGSGSGWIGYTEDKNQFDKAIGALGRFREEITIGQYHITTDQ